MQQTKKQFKLLDVIDYGEKLQSRALGQFNPENSILHMRWLEKKDRLPMPTIIPKDT